MEIRKLRKFVRLAMNHIERIGTREDLLILLEIADNQTSDRCLTLKQLALSGIAPESTLKRRLARLAKRGLITKATGAYNVIKWKAARWKPCGCWARI